MATAEKRPKFENLKDGQPFQNLSIFILPQKIQKRRLEVLKRGARAKHLPIVEKFCCGVSHVVSEYDTVEQTMRALKCSPDEMPLNTPTVVTTAWLSLCIKSGVVVSIEDEHRTPAEKYLTPQNDLSLTSVKPAESSAMAEYACQRSTPLNHYNEMFTRPLQILEEHAEFKDDDVNYVRALAFGRAVATLKSLPRRVTSVQDAGKLPDIGGHCLHVIEDILDNGYSAEAEEIKESEWYKQMKLFTGVFGVGPATAKKWIQMGVSSITDAINHPDIASRADSRVAVGLKYFEDLSSPVDRTEAVKLEKFVQSELETLRPGTTVQLAGGFRRGKDTGHDIDLLISHPVEGNECGVLEDLLRRLERRHLVISGRHELGSYQELNVAFQGSKGSQLRSNLDHFDKWIGVLRLGDFAMETEAANSGETSEFADWDRVPVRQREDSSEQRKFQSQSSTLSIKFETKIDPNHNEDKDPNTDMHGSCKSSAWVARRVDLIVIPASQYYYGVVGWTGNTHFNRSMRLYAQKELGLKLTSHGLFDSKGRSIPATSEKEVFENLKLTYREPQERNC